MADTPAEPAAEAASAAGASASTAPAQEEGASLLTGLSLDAAPAASPAPSLTAPVVEAAPAGTTPPAAEASAKAQTEPAATFLNAATKELRATPEFAKLSKYKTFDDLAKSVLALEAAQAAVVQKPTETSTDEERAAYRKSIGMPEKAEDYALEQGKLPEGLRWDSTKIAAFRDQCFALELPLSQAQAMYEWANKVAVDGFEASKADKKRAIDATVSELRKDFGTDFAKELASSNACVQAMDKTIPGLKAELNRSGFGNSKAGVKLFAQLAKTVLPPAIVGGEATNGSLESQGKILFKGMN